MHPVTLPLAAYLNIVTQNKNNYVVISLQDANGGYKAGGDIEAIFVVDLLTK